MSLSGNEIDTTNDFLVGVSGQYNLIMMRQKAKMTADEAIRLAAHLIAMADILPPYLNQNDWTAEDQFHAVLNAIQE